MYTKSKQHNRLLGLFLVLLYWNSFTIPRQVYGQPAVTTLAKLLLLSHYDNSEVHQELGHENNDANRIGAKQQHASTTISVDRTLTIDNYQQQPPTENKIDSSSDIINEISDTVNTIDAHHHPNSVVVVVDDNSDDNHNNNNNDKPYASVTIAKR